MRGGTPRFSCCHNQRGNLGDTRQKPTSQGRHLTPEDEARGGRGPMKSRSIGTEARQVGATGERFRSTVLFQAFELVVRST